MTEHQAKDFAAYWIVLYYTSVNGRMAAEVFEFDGFDKGVKVLCNYYKQRNGKPQINGEVQYNLKRPSDEANGWIFFHNKEGEK